MKWKIAPALIMTATLCTAAPAAFAESPALSSVTAAMQVIVDQQEVAGAVTLVATADRIIHLSAVGSADIAANRPMQTNTIFWIASMTKPLTAAAILMLQDEGKLSIDDPADQYLPELAQLKNADGKPAVVTLRQMLTHTSGISEGGSQSIRTLTELIPLYTRHLRTCGCAGHTWLGRSFLHAGACADDSAERRQFRRHLSPPRLPYIHRRRAAKWGSNLRIAIKALNWCCEQRMRRNVPDVTV